MEVPDLAEKQAHYTERLGQEAIREPPEERVPWTPPTRDEHDRHRCTPADPDDPWSEAACVRPW